MSTAWSSDLLQAVLHSIRKAVFHVGDLMSACSRGSMKPPIGDEAQMVDSICDMAFVVEMGH